MKRKENNAYKSLMTVDLHTNKDSLSANQIASPRQKNPSIENGKLSDRSPSKKMSYNVNIPKTIGNTSSIRGGKVYK